MAQTKTKQTSGRTSAGTGQRRDTQKNTNKNTKKGTAKQAGSRTSAGRGQSSRKGQQTSESSFVGKEIGILVSFAVCVLLFLSNLGLCGTAGEAVRHVQCGVFGMLGYVFPIYLFAAILFYLSNRENPRAVAKLAVSAVMFLALCGLIGLISTKEFDSTMTVAEYYQASVQKPNGGAVGGLFLKAFCPVIGKVGAYVVDLILCVIGAVFITERSVIRPISRGGKKVYDSAKEDVARRRELHAERAEEKRRYRVEQKVSGVALDTTKLSGQPGTEPEEPGMAAQSVRISAGMPESARESDTPDGRMTGQEPDGTDAGCPDHPIRIIGLGRTQQAEVSKPSMDLPTDTPVIPVSGDILMPQKDTRTLAELEALDSLHDNVFARTMDQAVWKEAEESGQEADGDEDNLSIQLRQLQKSSQPASGRMTWDMPVLSDVTEEAADDPDRYSGLEQPDGTDISSALEKKTIAEESADTDQTVIPADRKRVVTAGGKVMEVDIDPDEDPLTRKRRENSLAGTRSFAGNDTENGALRMPGRTALKGAYGTGADAFSKGFGEETGSGRFATGAASAPSKPAPKPRPYVRPPYNLMKAGDKNERHGSDRELRETARKLETTLQNFGVGATVTNISCGPTVTRYELQPEQGVRVSKIVGLADDIKLNLAAADIRIEAPIPGKASIGIEVPNKENATVFLRDVLESPAFRNHPSKLAFALGRDISGEVVVTDLAKMPHLLIAGATGSGKSVCINTLIMSVLYKATPEEVRLIMVDPKVVELNVYNGIPHLMIPVVTDPKKAAGALNWAVAEMMDRYRKFADWNVRDLKGYNEKVREEAKKNGEEPVTLPQIVIIVDELSDLMMVCPGDVEDAICRLAQMARAGGIYLVLATQRPSVNVITGLIKANVPSRIAFSVSSGVDSRTIIDMNGAEKLLGKGDMLFYPSGYPKPVRVQGAFVSDTEVSAVVEYVTAHNQSQIYDSAVEARMASLDAEAAASGGGAAMQGPERDEYFAEAGRFIIEKQKASIGMLQRVFKIGFNRAARIMDQLAEKGVVSEDAGTKAREILMDMNQYEQLLKSMGL